SYNRGASFRLVVETIVGGGETLYVVQHDHRTMLVIVMARALETAQPTPLVWECERLEAVRWVVSTMDSHARSLAQCPDLVDSGLQNRKRGSGVKYEDIECVGEYDPSRLEPNENVLGHDRPHKDALER